MRPVINRFPGSLVLSCFDLAVCVLALFLAFALKSAAAFVLFTVVIPICLLITLFYLAVDLARGRSRQAIAALLLSLPTIAVQIWFYRNLDL